MKTTQKTINQIAIFEGFRDTAYYDPAGILTIGYGHTYGVYEGQKINKLQALELLKQDIEKFENMVMAYNYVYHWNINEFSAMVSFAFNIGNIDQVTAYGTRTKAEIADAMLKYVYAGNSVLEGLLERRHWEHDLFISKDGLDEADAVRSDMISIDDVAHMVINGDFGNDDERVERLGRWFYEIVQGRVNQILRGE